MEIDPEKTLVEIIEELGVSEGIITFKRVGVRFEELMEENKKLEFKTKSYPNDIRGEKMSKSTELLEGLGTYLTVRTWDLYLYTGNSGWNVGKFYTKKDAEKAKSFLEKIPQYGNGSTSDLKPVYKIKDEHGYIQNQQDFDKISKAVGKLELQD